MAQCVINGYELPDDNLTMLEDTYSDIHSNDSGRGETGVMNITYVRTNVRKISIELVNITGAQLSDMRTALNAKPLAVTVKDEAGGETSLTMYNGDISAVLKFIDISGTRYYDVSFAMTEI